MSRRGTPLVSVITVCLNAERHLRTAMDSVLNQSYEHIEYIVIDGGSKDGTLSIIRDYEQRFAGRMRWISEPDEGLYDAMNKGVSMAAGTLIGILNADDFYEPDAVEQVVDTWSTHPEAGVVYGDLSIMRGLSDSEVIIAPEHIDMREMRRDMCIYHPAAFITAATYRLLGGYDTRYRIAADYDFLLRCLEEGVRFTYAHAVLTNFSPEGVSMRNACATDRDATLVRIAHGVNPLVARMRFYKRIFASLLFGRLKSSRLFLAAYSRYKGTT